MITGFEDYITPLVSLPEPWCKTNEYLYKKYPNGKDPFYYEEITQDLMKALDALETYVEVERKIKIDRFARSYTQEEKDAFPEDYWPEPTSEELLDGEVDMRGDRIGLNIDRFADATDEHWESEFAGINTPEKIERFQLDAEKLARIKNQIPLYWIEGECSHKMYPIVLMIQKTHAAKKKKLAFEPGEKLYTICRNSMLLPPEGFHTAHVMLLLGALRRYYPVKGFALCIELVSSPRHEEFYTEWFPSNLGMYGEYTDPNKQDIIDFCNARIQEASQS